MSQKLSFSIAPDGLALHAQIGLPVALLQSKVSEGESFLGVVTVRALLDTAADATSVSQVVLDKLGLFPHGQVQMITAGGIITVDRYEVSLSIFGPDGPSGPGLIRPYWNVTSFAHSLPGIDCLIGLDLIRQIALHIDGPSGAFALNF